MISKALTKEDLLRNEYFKLYVNAFLQTKQSYPKRISEEEKQQIELSRIYEYIIGVEYEKILVFTLIRNQITTIITALRHKETKGIPWL